MARSRNIKPGFFTNDDLVELDFATRLLFAGLWTVADRAGRMEDRPKKIKIAVFPADDLDIDAMLNVLAERRFITRYEANGVRYIQIDSWAKHQNPHHTEKASLIPPPNGAVTVKEPFEQRESQEEDGGNPADSLIPDSLIPEEEGEQVAPAPAKKPKPPQPGCPEDVELQVWDDWLALRRKKSAPVTKTVIAGAREEAKKAGMSFNAFLKVWCMRGSQGLDATWLKPADKAKARDDEAEWHQSRSGVEGRAKELGIGAWNELEEQWPQYRQRVMKADKGGGGLTLDQLMALGAQRKAA